MNLSGFVVEQLLESFDVDAFLSAYEYTIIVHARHPRLLQFLERYVLPKARREVILIFLNVGELVYLVEDHNHLLVAGVAHVMKRFIYNLYLLFKLWVRDVYNMD